MSDKETTTNEDLAILINNGFDGVQKQFDGVYQKFKEVDQQFEKIDGRFNKVDEHLEYLDARLGRLEADVHTLKEERLTRLEFEDALSRLKLVERKLNIDSGK